MEILCNESEIISRVKISEQHAGKHGALSSSPYPVILAQHLLSGPMKTPQNRSEALKSLLIFTKETVVKFF